MATADHRNGHRHIRFRGLGLITPGSALYATLSSPVLPIVIGILTGGGALVMNIVFVPILRHQAGTYSLTSSRPSGKSAQGQPRG